MSYNDGSEAIATIIALVVLAILGGTFMFGAQLTDSRWEKRLVDQPEMISAIKSRVLAERAVEATETLKLGGIK